jgi:hypothetical protein
MRGSATILALALAVVAALAAGCGPSDPKAGLLEERARWDVRILSWAEQPEGGLNVATRVSGPPSSSLRELTVRLDFLDASETKIGERWHTFDLSQVPRGGPADVMVFIPDPGVSVENLSLRLVLRPTPEEERHIKELED